MGMDLAAFKGAIEQGKQIADLKHARAQLIAKRTFTYLKKQQAKYKRPAFEVLNKKLVDLMRRFEDKDITDENFDVILSQLRKLRMEAQELYSGFEDKAESKGEERPINVQLAILTGNWTPQAKNVSSQS